MGLVMGMGRRGRMLRLERFEGMTLAVLERLEGRKGDGVVCCGVVWRIYPLLCLYEWFTFQSLELCC